MDINEMKKIKNDAELVNAVYSFFDEKSRLNCSNAARVEFTTTVKYIEKYLKQGMRILDIGAGAGEYSIYFANKGYKVNAVELADKNVEDFRKKIADNMEINLRQGNALDLSDFEDETFDIVLLFGPLYHLHEENDRNTAIREAKRVLNIAFINNDMLHYTEWGYNPDYLVSDGMGELLEDRINKLDEAGYAQYLKMHLFYCEKPEHLGKTNHFLFVVKKFCLL